MKTVTVKRRQTWQIGWAAVAFALLVAAGCKTQTPARTDQQIATDIQAKIRNESALNGQDIQVSVVNGVATLSGTAADAASRALAGNDSGAVPGVKTVVNNLTVEQAEQPAPPEMASAAPAEAQRPERRSPSHSQDRRTREGTQPVSPPAPVAPPPQQAQVAAAAMPAAAPAPPKPAMKQVTLPAGTTIPVRITEMLSSKDAQPNDVFHASLASDLGIQGVIALHQGAPILGRVVDARDATHFKGNSLLSLELTQLSAGGHKITLVTAPYEKEGTGRGKNTLEKAGGGAILGAILGGLAGGGKGAAIGTLAGGAAGTGVNAATRGQQVEIPAETLINFQLQSPVTITVAPAPGESSDSNQFPEPQLQHRQ